MHLKIATGPAKPAPKSASQGSWAAKTQVAAAPSKLLRDVASALSKASDRLGTFKR